MNMEHNTLSVLEAELQEVQKILTATADELGMPLGELVRAQVKVAAPHQRAALVLTVGDDPNHSDAGRSDPGPHPDTRSRRIYLAAALEMLAIALHVHRLLVMATGLERGNDLDKSFIGSTILAGDYCFSRAANMAVQTENPRVVTLFSQALQTVSEGHLRALFAADEAIFDENRALLQSGAEAAVELAGVSPEVAPAYQATALALADLMAQSGPNRSSLAYLLSEVPIERRPRWQALAQWLMGERTNGSTSRRELPV